MKTNTTIVKALAFAMLFATACNKNEIANDENTEKKGFALPVTVNVTREGDDATKATYNETSKKLEFSAGDKLFVSGSAYAAGSFAGTLNYVSEGTFRGTIYTEYEYSGTANALFSAANDIYATLLPNGYGSYNFLSIIDKGTSEKYDDEAVASPIYAFVASETAKATGVEQLSFEKASNYSSGFALAPQFAILNFTISGLEAGAKNVTLYVKLTDGPDITVTGSVTPNASGVATFAIGVPGGFNIKDISNNLTVGSHNFTLSSSKTFEAGKIYNINRAAPAATDLSTINANYTASNGETLTGTLGANVKISIADGATVTLNNVTINGVNDSHYVWAGITCLGDATIILSGTNTVKGFYENYPGIQPAAGNTLTINGTGSLTASSYAYAAAIGGGNGLACGNIEIQGGTITATSGGRGAGIGGGINANCGNITISGGTVTATGGERGAGIGGGYNASWGNITISGGTVTATGGNNGAGIGGGKKGNATFSCGNIYISGGTVTATGGQEAAGIGGGRGNNSTDISSCGTITITTGVTKVTATKGSSADNSIGAGYYGTCGTVTIGGNVGAITTSPYTYQPVIIPLAPHRSTAQWCGAGF